MALKQTTFSLENRELVREDVFEKVAFGNPDAHITAAKASISHLDELHSQQDHLSALSVRTDHYQVPIFHKQRHTVKERPTNAISR